MAIPRGLLPSSMSYRDPADTEDGFGGEYGPAKVTAHIRFEQSDARASGGSMPSYERHESPSGRIWVDAVNSSGGVPAVGALVSVDGGPEMAVRRVTPYHGSNGRLHHTELEVG